MSKVTVNHSIAFTTDFILENMNPAHALMIQSMDEETLKDLCNRALTEGLKEHFIDKVNSEATWGILRLAGE